MRRKTKKRRVRLTEGNLLGKKTKLKKGMRKTTRTRTRTLAPAPSESDPLLPAVARRHRPESE